MVSKRALQWVQNLKQTHTIDRGFSFLKIELVKSNCLFQKRNSLKPWLENANFLNNKNELFKHWLAGKKARISGTNDRAGLSIGRSAQSLYLMAAGPGRIPDLCAFMYWYLHDLLFALRIWLQMDPYFNNIFRLYVYMPCKLQNKGLKIIITDQITLESKQYLVQST